MTTRPEFAPIPLNPNGAHKVEEVRAAFSQLADTLDQILPQPGREKSLAATHLQTACMFAVRAVAAAPPNQADLADQGSASLPAERV